MPVFSTQPFWASRLKANTTVGFFSRSRIAKSLETGDRCIAARAMHIAPPGLQNRKRVWNLIQSLTNILNLRLNDLLELCLWDPSQVHLRWREGAGDVREEKPAGTFHGFDKGCHLFNKKCVWIPDLLSQIAFSIIRLEDTEYIAGIRLIPSKGTDVCLGYRASGKELFWMFRFL